MVKKHQTKENIEMCKQTYLISVGMISAARFSTVSPLSHKPPAERKTVRQTNHRKSRVIPVSPPPKKQQQQTTKQNTPTPNQFDKVKKHKQTPPLKQNSCTEITLKIPNSIELNYI